MIKKILKSIILFILTLEAWLVVRKYKPVIVAVTGSVGKTTSKDAIADVLEKKFYVARSQKSFNSEFGVPLSILRQESGWGSMYSWFKILLEGILLIAFKNHYPKYLVLEVGTDRPGDIPRITRWLKPHVGVLTSIPQTPVHIEFFPSKEDLVEEKVSLLEAVGDGGAAILNIDDKDTKRAVHKIHDKKVITYGFSEEAMVRALTPEIFYDEKGHPLGVRCRIEYGDKVLPLQITGTIARSSVYSALSAFCVGLSFEMNMVEMLDTLGGREVSKGRSRLLKGTKGSTLIDDTYNSSPVALAVALESLGEVKTKGRKIAVLGDMLELGKHTAEEHEKMGSLAKAHADVLVTVGHRARLSADEAYKKKMAKKNIFTFESSTEAGEFLKDFIEKDDIVLFKGSQGVRMEKALEFALEHKDKAKDLLVRQEKEWLER